MIESSPPLSAFGRIHFIGIGGIGMSGLAEMCLKHGKKVSGSDLYRSDLTDRLCVLGADIRIGHEDTGGPEADLVVYSAAVSPQNPELRYARERGVLTVTRADLLGALTRPGHTIAVAGTHGKTTTTAMIGLVLMAAGFDPTLAVGGMLPEIGSNVRTGQSPWMVVEADEYDRSFHVLAPMTSVITSVDADHMEYYGSQQAIDEAFAFFAHLVPCDHPIVVCIDDPGVRRIAPALRRRKIEYGFSEKAEIRAERIALKGLSCEADLYVRGRFSGRLHMERPGKHHLLDALGALAIADLLEIPVSVAIEALAGYKGVKRRFEIKGEARGVLVIDDYAHHPNEIRATLDGLKGVKDRRVVAVFQPHLYTRTRDFTQDFGVALAEARVGRVIVTDVYGSREAPIAGVSGAMIVEAARVAGGTHVSYLPGKQEVVETLIDLLEPGDLLLTLGAGDVDRIGEATLAALRDGKPTA
ncbi:MAG: UDP-N-acetylmuramate--L-alanine ligase [candidate division Zixibacteria bacterium]|nr:UDP-N-acetylmuramate--L-alanine ligase [candidate division Zixibacteria bacterium]